LPDENCTFVPDEEKNPLISSSIMAAPFLENVKNSESLRDKYFKNPVIFR
jgi:hypothetical protein